MPRVTRKSTAAKSKKPIPSKASSKRLAKKSEKPSGKATNEVAAKRAAGKKAAGKKAVPFHGGTYTTPKGNVTLGLPAFWTLRQTNDDLELDSPSGSSSVILTAFHREAGFSRLDAREYLEQFLRTAAIKGRPKTEQNGRTRAVSRFRDTDGDYWQVEFLSDGDTLLLVTFNTSLPARNQESQIGARILGTIRLR